MGTITHCQMTGINNHK